MPRRRIALLIEAINPFLYFTRKIEAESRTFAVAILQQGKERPRNYSCCIKSFLVTEKLSEFILTAYTPLDSWGSDMFCRVLHCGRFCL